MFLGRERIKIIKQINIYHYLIIKTIIITIIILWESFPARVVCVLSVCVSLGGGSRSLLKLSQPGSCWKPGSCWQAGKCWKWYWGMPCGKAAQPQPQSGRYSAVRITTVRRPETGRYSFLRITAVSGALYFAENNGTSAGQQRYFDFRITVSEAMAILDNLYKKCYNKCNDDNKNAICHQSPKFALQSVFPLRDIKSR